MDRQNIVLFMVDQMTSFVLNAYGGQVCKTPHLAVPERVSVPVSLVDIFPTLLDVAGIHITQTTDPNTNYVRRGDAFPTVERRGYLHYSNGRTTL